MEYGTLNWNNPLTFLCAMIELSQSEGVISSWPNQSDDNNSCSIKVRELLFYLGGRFERLLKGDELMTINMNCRERDLIN